VIVEGEQKAVSRPERIRLTDQTQPPGRVRGEDRHVLVRRRAEELEHRCAGPLDEFGHRRRRRVQRVRVAENVLPQQVEMLAELRVGVEARTGVVEIDVSAGVEASEVVAS